MHTARCSLTYNSESSFGSWLIEHLNSSRCTKILEEMWSKTSRAYKNIPRLFSDRMAPLEARQCRRGVLTICFICYLSSYFIQFMRFNPQLLKSLV